MLFDGANVINSVNIVSDNMASVSYSKTDAYVDDLPNTNPIIATWVTAQARLKLYTYLEKLQEKVLYFDTGLIVCVTNLLFQIRLSISLQPVNHYYHSVIIWAI